MYARDDEKHESPLLEGGNRICAKAATKEHLFRLLLRPADGALHASALYAEGTAQQKPVNFAVNKETGVCSKPLSVRPGYEDAPRRFFRRYTIVCTNDPVDGSFWRVSAGKEGKEARARLE